MPLVSAESRTCACGRTSKPRIIALDASASETSVSVIAPTPARTMAIDVPGTLIFSNAPLNASIEPCVSALTIKRSSFSLLSAFLKNSSSVTILSTLFSSRTLLCERLSAMSLARRSSGNTMKASPAKGTSDNPVISTGVAGTAALKVRPKSSDIARIFPKWVPTTK